MAPPMSAPPISPGASSREARYQAAVNSPTAKANRRKATGSTLTMAEQAKRRPLPRPGAPVTAKAPAAVKPLPRPTMGLQSTPFGQGMNGEPALAQRPFGMSMNGEVNPTALANSRSRMPAQPAAQPAGTTTDWINGVSNAPGIGQVGSPAPMEPPTNMAPAAMIEQRTARALPRGGGRNNDRMLGGAFSGQTFTDVQRKLDAEYQAMTPEQRKMAGM